jgi:quercetin dioxygenase-like cupin family protein
VAVELDVAQGRLLRVDEGEAITDKPNRELRLLCAHPLLTLCWLRYGAGERGANPHFHREHSDAFYVLDGQVTVRLGPELEPVIATPGTLVVIPAGVVHAFDNDGPGEARFLDFHASDGGFARYLRTGEEEGFDSYDPPEDGGRPISDAVVRRAGEGELLEFGPSTLLMKAEDGDGDGTFYLGETTLGTFPGPPPHLHERHLDSFFVLEGTLSLRLGDETVAAPAGSYAYVPPGNVHTFSNPGESTVRVLNIMAPGGFEQYLKEAAAASTTDPAVLGKIAARYDFRPV